MPTNPMIMLKPLLLFKSSIHKPSLNPVSILLFSNIYTIFPQTLSLKLCLSWQVNVLAGINKWRYSCILNDLIEINTLPSKFLSRDLHISWLHWNFRIVLIYSWFIDISLFSCHKIKQCLDPCRAINPFVFLFFSSSGFHPYSVPIRR